ncbi:MAG: C40 family peptidase [Hominilimicola sp.]
MQKTSLRTGTAVNKDELQLGDLVFFEQNGYIHHVGIYAGDGMMIHAPRTGDVVKYQSWKLIITAVSTQEQEEFTNDTGGLKWHHL